MSKANTCSHCNIPMDRTYTHLDGCPVKLEIDLQPRPVPDAIPAPLTMDAYQKQALSYEMTAMKGDPLFFKALGIGGETGEYQEQVKKFYRDDKGPLTQARREAMLGELGDVLWYVASNAGELGCTLEELARRNLAKIEDRAQRNKMRGSGDHR